MPINFFHLRSRYGNQSCNICAQKETFYYLPPNNKYEKEVCCSTTWKVHIPNIGILVGIEESPVSTRQCPWWDARHGRPNSIEYLVLHATWWPGRMVHTLVLHPHPGDSSMAHHQQSLPLSLSQDGDGGNREKHSGQDRQLMIQGRICLKGHIWKAFSNCIRRQLYHNNNVLLYVGTIRQAILAPFVTIIEL